MIALRRLLRRTLLRVLPTGSHDDIDGQGRDQSGRAGVADGRLAERAGAPISGDRVCRCEYASAAPFDRGFRTWQCETCQSGHGPDFEADGDVRFRSQETHRDQPSD